MIDEAFDNIPANRPILYFLTAISPATTKPPPKEVGKHLELTIQTSTLLRGACASRNTRGKRKAKW